MFVTMLADQRPSCPLQEINSLYAGHWIFKMNLATQIKCHIQVMIHYCIHQLSLSFDIYLRSTNFNMFDQIFMVNFKRMAVAGKKRAGMKLICLICYSCISCSSSCLIHIILQMIWQSGLRGYTGEEGSRARRNIALRFSSSVIISQAVAEMPRG